MGELDDGAARLRELDRLVEPGLGHLRLGDVDGHENRFEHRGSPLKT